jgi:hypothetical protein
VTAAEVQALVLEEIGDDWSLSNAHGVDLRKCLVPPRKVRCKNTFPELRGGKPFDVWIVLEETPGSPDGYLIIFDEGRQAFGLADWYEGRPSLCGFYGSFRATLIGM